MRRAALIAHNAARGRALLGIALDDFVSAERGPSSRLDAAGTPAGGTSPAGDPLQPAREGVPLTKPPRQRRASAPGLAILPHHAGGGAVASVPASLVTPGRIGRRGGALDWARGGGMRPAGDAACDQGGVSCAETAEGRGRGVANFGKEWRPDRAPGRLQAADAAREAEETVALSEGALLTLRLLVTHFGTSTADTLTRALVALADKEGLQALAGEIAAATRPRHGNSAAKSFPGARP